MSRCPFSALKNVFGIRKPPESLLKHKEHAAVTLEVGQDNDIQAQMRMIDLTAEDLKILKSIQPLVHEQIEMIVASFYNTVLQVPLLEQIIVNNSTVERLKSTLRQHLIEMFSGEINEEFIQKRLRIAQIHQKIGLEPKWYMGAFQNLQNTLLEMIHHHITDAGESLVIGRAVTKLLNFEQQLVLDAYEKENTRIKEEQYQQVKDELKSKIAVVSEELASLTEETSASVEEMVASSQDVNQSFRQSAGKAKHSMGLSEAGQEKIKRLGMSMASIHESTDRIKEAVKELTESAGQIGKIVTIVQEIAGQTSMLSLNAAIEAARAGEHGKGFSVVAKEVQKLSVDTKNAVGQISSFIAQTTQSTDHVTDMIRTVQKVVDAGQAESETASEVFDEITRAMAESLAEIEQVEREMGSLVQVIEGVGDATANVAISAETLNQATKSL